MAVDLFALFPVGASGPTSVRRGFDELGYCRRQCDRWARHGSSACGPGGAFYLYGALGLLWFVYWTAQASSGPSATPDWEQPGVPPDCAENTDTDTTASSPAAHPNLTPRRMLRSRAVWAVIVAHVCINWSLYLVLSWFPTFINQELGADLQLAGLLALAPTVVCLLWHR